MQLGALFQRAFMEEVAGAAPAHIHVEQPAQRLPVARRLPVLLAEMLREGLDERPGVRRAHGWQQVAAVAATLSVPGEGAAKKKKSAEAKRSLIG